MLKLMKVLYDCGAVTNDEIEKLGLDMGIVDDLIKKEQLVVKRIGDSVVYFLTDFGEKVYRLNTNKKTFFRCANVPKMQSLLKFYAALSEEERNTWKSKDVWYLEGYVGSIPDATYLKDGKMYAVYVTTNNTDKNRIASVEKFVKERSIENVSYLK